MNRGGPSGPRRGGRGYRGGGNNSNNAPPQSILQKQITKPRPEFSIVPLVLEGLSTTKFELNKLIVTQLPDAKLSDIQLNRNNGTFTLHAADVKSFNILLNGTAKLSSANEKATIRIPRTIQRILDTEKDAFVKNVDLDIDENDITTELSKNGFVAEKVSRIQKKDNSGSTQTVKITFADSQNRDSFVKVGLQIQHMHFLAERANQNMKPVQCFICLQFGHVSKYCKQGQNQICARCGEKHRQENCDKTNLPPVCCNCKGEHLAMSNDCPKFKEHQQKMKSTIEKYSATSSKTNMEKAPRLNDGSEFPGLPQSLANYPAEINEDLITQIITRVTESMTTILQEVTERMIDKINQRFKCLVDHLLARADTQLEDENLSDSETNETKREQTRTGNRKEDQQPRQNRRRNQQTSSQETASLDRIVGIERIPLQQTDAAAGLNNTPNNKYFYRPNSPSSKRKEISPNGPTKASKAKTKDHTTDSINV